MFIKKQGFRLPQRLIERIRQIVPGKKTESVLHAFGIKRPTTIRANTLKISGLDLMRQFRAIGIKLDTVFWYKDAFVVRNRTLRELRELKYYKEGYFYVQSLSSMIPAIVLHPKPQETILDLCAAPGSKTTQIAAMMENKGKIIANEPNPIRWQKLNANLLKQGVSNTEIISMHGEDIHKKYEDCFDRALVDAPCSGEGIIHTFDVDTYRGWGLGKIERYVQIQKKLLIAALLSVKKGGVVVYSTCTLEPEENEGVVDWILEKAKGFVKLEQVFIGDNVSYEGDCGFGQWGDVQYSRELSKTVRIWPGKLMEGFFVAKIRKR